MDFALPLPAGSNATADIDGNGIVSSTDLVGDLALFFGTWVGLHRCASGMCRRGARLV